MSSDTCSICGGDGRITNSFGNHTTCPGCRGSGRKAEDLGFHDVTKTKPSHHQRSNKAPVVEKQKWPSTYEGGQLANEVRDSTSLSVETKARLTQDIITHEDTHATCTQTFIKKMRKQLRPLGA